MVNVNWVSTWYPYSKNLHVLQIGIFYLKDILGLNICYYFKLNVYTMNTLKIKNPYLYNNYIIIINPYPSMNGFFGPNAYRKVLWFLLSALKISFKKALKNQGDIRFQKNFL